MQKQNERNIIFLFELGHIDASARFLTDHPKIQEEGCLLIALDPEIESILTEKGIPFRSGRTYRTPDAEPRIVAGDYTAAIFNSDRWSFFTYRGVSLARTYSFSLQVYLTELLYQVDIISNVMARHPSSVRCVVFPPLSAKPVMGSCLMGHWIEIPIDTVKYIAGKCGKEVIVPKTASPAGRRTHYFIFTPKRIVFGWWITLLNFFISSLRRPRRIRILVSDYWKNLAPSLRYLDSVEVIFLDRLEAFNAGISNIWKFRMQFWHLDAYSSGFSSERKNAGDLFIREWLSIQRGPDLPICLFRGFSLRPLLFPVLESIVEEAVRKTLKDIDGAHGMLARLKPDVVMLRATTSAQPHFSILAQVARTQNIPSLEMLHGLDYYGPGSSYKFHGAEYVGVYGGLIKKQMAHIKPKDTKLVIIGSPRFDVYAYLQKEKHPQNPSRNGISFLCIAPAVGAGDIDMYDIVDYFSAIASALQKIPNSSATIKFRPVQDRDSFVRATIASQFATVPYTIAQSEPLWDIFPKADVVISCFSTPALEALSCGKPLVYLGLSPSQQMLGLYHFSTYREQGAIRIATSKEELLRILSELASNEGLREQLSREALAFLEREYAFDGHASERTVELIRSLALGENN